MKHNIWFTIFLTAGCASGPRCGYPEGNRVIYENQKTCVARIRQVTVGADLRVPESLKGAGMADFRLEWVEPGLVNGRIVFGHFVMVPRTEKTTR